MGLEMKGRLVLVGFGGGEEHSLDLELEGSVRSWTCMKVSGGKAQG